MKAIILSAAMLIEGSLPEQYEYPSDLNREIQSLAIAKGLIRSDASWWTLDILREKNENVKAFPSLECGSRFPGGSHEETGKAYDRAMSLRLEAELHFATTGMGFEAVQGYYRIELAWNCLWQSRDPDSCEYEKRDWLEHLRLLLGDEAFYHGQIWSI